MSRLNAFTGSKSLNMHLFGLNFDKLGENMPCCHFWRLPTLGKYRARLNTKNILICDVDLLTGYNILYSLVL